MLPTYEAEISKELYDEAMLNDGRFTKEMENNFFTDSIRYGYGLYGTKVFEKDGKYYVRYTTGSHCD